jgi:hypothetical protein
MTDHAAQAAEYRKDSAKAYRQGRIAQRDAERWDQAAVNCDRGAEFWDGHADWNDPEDELSPAEQAAQSRRNAEAFRELAESERNRIPSHQERGRFYAAQARAYQVRADEQAVRIAEWAASPERAEWLARPENATLRELDAAIVERIRTTV